MNADPIKSICAELERKLIETRDRRLTGKVAFEADVTQGGIGSAQLRLVTEEVCNLKTAAKGN